ncbi:MAG: hypothetical protein GY739_19415 [Mesoflavibacter sp.]|nr:hypothetical protein [Mesoflavibacter sp.]
MLRIKFLKKLADILFYIGKFDSAISVLEKLVDLFDKIKNKKRFSERKKVFISDCHLMLVHLYEQQGYSEKTTKNMRQKSMDALY